MISFLTLKNDLYRMVGATTGTVRTDIQEAVRIAIANGQQRFALFASWGFLDKFQDMVNLPLQAPYNTGTVTVTQDSKTVTGAGTAWTQDMAGTSFFHLLNQEPYEIRSVASATSFQLSIPYQNTTPAAGQSYEILKRYYPLPLDFLRPVDEDAKLLIPGGGESDIESRDDNIFFDEIRRDKPSYFSIQGNTRINAYYNTGTVTVATASGVSTWTVSTGTLPTDSVDRQVRIEGEDRFYTIQTRSGNTTFISYETYVNPATQTSTQATASVWSMTPKETVLVGFQPIPDRRYIFRLPYIKRLPELLLDTDISPISLAGFDDALLAVCRAELAQDGRTAMRGDLVNNLNGKSQFAMQEAWCAEQMRIGDGVKNERTENRRKGKTSWLG